MLPDKEYVLNIPLNVSLRNGKILLAASSFEAQKKFEPYLDLVKGILEMEGNTLLYLPEVFESITPEIAAYAFPGVDVSTDAIQRIYDKIFSVLPPGNDQIRLVRYDGGETKFFIIDLDNIEESLREYADNLWESHSYLSEYSLSPLPGPEPVGACEDSHFDDIILNEEAPFTEEELNKERCLSKVKPASVEKPSKKTSKPKGKLFVNWMKNIEVKMYDLYEDAPKEEVVLPSSPIPVERIEQEREVDLELDKKTEKIIAELEALKTKYNLSDKDLESILGRKVPLSDLCITKSGRIYLPEYNNRELDLDIKSKALYILFIKHPEGIGYKYLQDYRKELLNIYSSISNRDDIDELVATVDKLVDPMNTDAVSISVSRIKKAFKDIMTDKVAQNYYVKGKQGYPKMISLDRSRVKFV